MRHSDGCPERPQRAGVSATSTRADLPDPVGAMLATVRRLWPDAADVRLSTRSDSVSDRGTAAATLLMVPNARSPRLLVPSGRRAAARSLLRFNAAIGLRETLSRTVAAGALRVVGERVLADRIEVFGDGDGDSIQRYLSGVLNEPVTVSIGIGTARANRKPVIEVFDRSGRQRAFAKVGDTDVAERHVRGEAESLQVVGEEEWTHLRVPELLHTGTWNGMYVLVMSAFSTSPRQGRPSRRGIPRPAMRELATRFAAGRMPLTATAMWQRCVAAVGEVIDPTTRRTIEELLGVTVDAVATREVDVGAWHGDFTPWNMARAGDHVQLWDWERFQEGVPIGFDELHYVAQTRARRDGYTAAALLDGLRSERPASEDPGSADAALVAAYLASLTCRYVLGAQDVSEGIAHTSADAALEALRGHCLRTFHVGGTS